MKVGQYGVYNQVWGIVLEVRGNKVLIIDGDGVKKQINASNFQAREGNVIYPVTYEGAEYLVSKTKRIISLTTNKFMKWDDEHPIRKGILAVRGIERVKQVMKHDQLTLEV